MLIIEVLEVKLKYLADDKIPESLFTEAKDVTIINQFKVS